MVSHILKTLIYLAKKAQIILLNLEKAFDIIPIKYSVWLTFWHQCIFKKLAAVLLEHNGINNYIIDLKEDKQLLYEPFYSLGPVELETLKTYI